MNSSLDHSPAWQRLHEHARLVSELHLRDIFDTDQSRGQRFVARGAGLYFDYSKNRLTSETLELLIALAEERGVPIQRDRMLRGERINVSENRAVLHTALRLPREATLEIDGHDLVPVIHQVLDRMSAFSNKVISGEWRGYSGRPITNVVNIGIGGSDLGPVMAYRALRSFATSSISFHFVSNVDPTELTSVLANCRPEETLFVVCSKTFGTLETLSNALAAKEWLVSAAQEESAVSRHFVAVSSNRTAVDEFGINVDNMFEMWEWVGGRYSIDSAVGLSTMIAIGPENFRSFLKGFREMDEHFANTPIRENLPMLHGLIAVWNRNFLGFDTLGVMPYCHELSRFAAYLQQLTMESNGKHVTLEGERTTYDTGMIVWGEPGTNAQHSFFQLLHQGTTIVPLDFIGVARSTSPLGDQHDTLVANLFAQSRALAFGQTLEEIENVSGPSLINAHRVMEGNRPSNVILAHSITPRFLGALISFYENSVFVQGAIWNIDSFDQWGVEFGKALASEIGPELNQDFQPTLKYDSSTNELIALYRRWNEGENS